MPMRKGDARSSGPRRKSAERLQDEVYRHMFRLEAGLPGADLDLAIALLRAWMASDLESEKPKFHGWLKKICPICLLMIQAAQHGEDQPCPQ